MAIDFPPPLPPQQGELQQLQQSPEAAAITFKEYRIHWLGAKPLSDAQLQHAVENKDSLSDAVRGLSAALYAAGYPASRLSYALSGQDLYVLATLGKVSSVAIDRPIGVYFRGLAGADPLTDDALERRRVLASVHADRAGIAATPSFAPGVSVVPVTDGSTPSAGAPLSSDYTLSLAPNPEGGPDQNRFRVEFGNPGNRFVGRYFGDLDIRAGTGDGDEFRSFSRLGIHGLNTGSDGGTYGEQNLGWNRVTPYGIFGVGGRYAYYGLEQSTIVPVPVTGLIRSGEAYWLYPLFADIHSRTTISAKVDRIGKTTDLRDRDQKVQQELYNSAELGVAYLSSFTWLGHRWDFEGGVNGRKGFGDEHSTLTPADQGYWLVRPGLRLKYFFTDRYALGLEASGQFSDATVPEQQQWVLGGLGNLSAYLPGVAVGDKGYLVRAQGEAGAFPVYRGSEVRPRVFVEYAATQYNDLGGGIPRVADAGVEVGLKFTSWLSGSVAYARSFFDKDIPDPVLDATDARVYFRLQGEYGS